MFKHNLHTINIGIEEFQVSKRQLDYILRNSTVINDQEKCQCPRALYINKNDYLYPADKILFSDWIKSIENFKILKICIDTRTNTVGFEINARRLSKMWYYKVNDLITNIPIYCGNCKNKLPIKDK